MCDTESDGCGFIETLMLSFEILKVKVTVEILMNPYYEMCCVCSDLTTKYTKTDSALKKEGH